MERRFRTNRGRSEDPALFSSTSQLYNCHTPPPFDQQSRRAPQVSRRQSTARPMTAGRNKGRHAWLVGSYSFSNRHDSLWSHRPHLTSRVIASNPSRCMRGRTDWLICLCGFSIFQRTARYRRNRSSDWHRPYFRSLQSIRDLMVLLSVGILLSCYSLITLLPTKPFQGNEKKREWINGRRENHFFFLFSFATPTSLTSHVFFFNFFNHIYFPFLLLLYYNFFN